MGRSDPNAGGAQQGGPGGAEAWTVGDLGQNGWGLGLDGWRTSPEWLGN